MTNIQVYDPALLLERAANALKEISAVAHTQAKRYAVVPLLPVEPVGKDNLLALSAPPAGLMQGSSA
jgi:hypothetical protein